MREPVFTYVKIRSFISHSFLVFRYFFHLIFFLTLSSQWIFLAENSDSFIATTRFFSSPLTIFDSSVFLSLPLQELCSLTQLRVLSLLPWSVYFHEQLQRECKTAHSSVRYEDFHKMKLKTVFCNIPRM